VLHYIAAGGGVKRGFVYGESDKTGSYPNQRPVRPDDLAATMFYLWASDPNTEVAGLGNRPVLISEGKPGHGGSGLKRRLNTKAQRHEGALVSLRNPVFLRH